MRFAPKHLAILTVGASATLFALLFVGPPTSQAPAITHPSAGAPAAASLPSADLSAIAELRGSEDQDRSPLCTATGTSVTVQLVDRHTGRPASHLALKVTGVREGAAFADDLQSDRQGRLVVEPGLYDLSPANGFSFEREEQVVLCAGATVELAGQFRIRAAGSRGLRCALGSDCGPYALQGKARALPSPLEALSDGAEPKEWVSDTWAVFKTRTQPTTLMCADGSVSPPHVAWQHQRRDLGDGMVSSRLPTLVGPALAGTAFTPSMGESLEFQCEPLPTTAVLTLTRQTTGVGAATLMVHSIPEGGGLRGRRRFEQRMFGADDPYAVFENVPAGLYDVASATLANRTLLVASQTLRVQGGAYDVHESAGTGPYSLAIDPAVAEHGEWKLDAILGREEDGLGFNIPMCARLADIERIEGLALPECRLWLSRGAGSDFEQTHVDLDLTEVSTLRHVEP